MAADALPAIASDIPAAPHIGNAGFERFRFEVCFVRAIGNLSAAMERRTDVTVALFRPSCLQPQAAVFQENEHPPIPSLGEINGRSRRGSAMSVRARNRP